MVDVVFVGHALDAVPTPSANVRDIGGPIVSGGSHYVVNRLLLLAVGPSPVVVVHRKPSLRPVDEGGWDAGIRHDDRERSSELERT